MTLLFVDGFDHYATADVTKKWTSTGGSSLTISATGRRSGSSLRWTTASTSNGVVKTVTTGASFVIGFALRVSALPSSAAPICRLLDAGSVQCDLRLNTDGTLSVTRAGTAVTNGTSVASIGTGTYYYIEWKVTIADSIGANSCKVRINGVDAITVATGQDLKSTANASANQVSLNYAVVSGGINIDFDDFYICDQSGSANNDFLGDCRVDAIYPTSDGTYSEFVPSTGVDHYALVDETAPNTTDYNSGSAGSPGDRDSYGMGNLQALVAQTVYGVQVNAAVLKDDAGAISVATFVRSGTTNSSGATVGLSTSQTYISQVFETDPDTASAWTEATVNAMQAGMVIV